MKPSRPIEIHDPIMPELIKLVRNSSETIQDPVTRKAKFSLVDCLMCGIAMFELKYPSLLQFDNDSRKDGTLQHNLKSLFGVTAVPSDTYFRERLDPIDSHELQRPIDEIIKLLVAKNKLIKYKYNVDPDVTDESYIVSFDATGTFSSHEVHCESCCVKNHKDGTVTYYHQTLAAVMVHPDCKTVLPLAIEPITKKDGATKNDCEHNATKRLLVTLRESYPDKKMIIVMDGLYADSVIVSLLKQLKFSFIITAKETDLKYLFDEYKVSKKQEFSTKYPKEPELNYQFADNISLNDAHHEIKVNVLECIETNGSKKTKFCWITNLSLTKKTAKRIARAGRSRWKIENETFNTLKNQGYNFEHNFGHGQKNLGTVFAYLMFIAFLIDQAQQLCCEFFQRALAQCVSKIRLWRKMCALFCEYFVDSWLHLYLALINGGSRAKLASLIDTT